MWRRRETRRHDVREREREGGEGGRERERERERERTCVVMYLPCIRFFNFTNKNGATQNTLSYYQSYQAALPLSLSAAKICTFAVCLFVCWLLNVPATCECISGTDLLRQFDVLPH